MMSFGVFTLMVFVGLSQNNIEIGLSLGASQSGTDTHSWGNDGESIFAKTNLLVGLNAAYPITSKVKLRANWLMSKLEGDDRDVTGHENRAYSFTSPLHELSLDIKWNLWDNYIKENPGQLETDLNSSNKKFVAIYVAGGVGVSYTNPEVIYGTEPIESQKLQDEADLNKINLQIPIGLGANLKLSNKLNLDFEMRSIIGMTDLLDGMSEVVNPENNDVYLFALLRLNYQL